MRQSKLFTKTEKASKEFDSRNATLLTKAGFIEQQFAGVYNYLPLGLRVLKKIENIVREEMDEISTEILMPALASIEQWQTTNRFDSVDVLFKAIGANEISKKKSTNEYVLQGTHEESVTPLVKKFVKSYRDLPVAVYQIQNKFRNEARAKSGILRGREFLMKDLYSFHVDEASLKEYYKKVWEAYIKIFERLGFKLNQDLFVVKASGGDFTPDFSHEFQVVVDVGEDEIYLDAKSGEVFNREVAPSRSPTPAYLNDGLEMLPMEEVFGENIVGVDDLIKHLAVAAEQCVKTLIYRTDSGELVAVAIRGDYEVNELKLVKLLGVNHVELASDQEVRQATGSKIGYAGIVNLNSGIRLVCDDSIENLINFETGANKENYHNINVNWERDLKKPDQFFDIKLAKSGDIYPETGEVYHVYNASEVGNIFPLNTKFSDAFELNYQDEKGEVKPVYMGCYGIGISRVMGVIVEKFNDEKGIVWPKQVAPFHIHLVTLAKSHEDDSFKRSEQVYETLSDANLDILWDDRLEASAGEKFSDSDLIGIPIRVVVSDRSLSAGGAEVKMRDKNESTIVKFENLVDSLNDELAK